MATRRQKAKKPKQSKRIPRKQARRELKKKAVNYKGGKCEACGYSRCLASLTFHHRDPTEKDFNISDTFHAITWPRLKQELNKCILLCANCHYEVHDGILDGYIDG